MLKSLMTGSRSSPDGGETGETSIVDIYLVMSFSKRYANSVEQYVLRIHDNSPATLWRCGLVRPGRVLLRPRRDEAVHPRIGHQLTHVLVGVDDDPQIHAVHVGVNAFNLDFAPEIGGLGRGVGYFDGFERAL